MPITIGSNIASLQAQRRLNEGSDALSRVYERLASGLRINHASDDAAGLAVAGSLDANARVFGQSLRNINDGISALSISESAINELSKITTRIAELSEQAANGIYSAAQRTPLDNEAQALRNEFNRIIHTTKFNGITLLDGSTNGIEVQVGLDSGKDSRIQAGQGYVLKSITAPGAFNPAEQYSFSDLAVTQPYTVDVNRDGILDLIGAGSNFEVRLGNGDGTFGAEITSPAVFAGTLGVGDANGDGYPDITWANNSGTIAFALGNGNGTFGTLRAVDNLSSTPSLLALRDFNNDGNADILNLNIPGATTSVAVYLGNGNGTFKGQLLTNVSFGQNELGLGDFNSDGILDLASHDGTDTLHLFIGNGDGSFKAGTVVGGEGGYRNMSVGDVDGDGKLDLISTVYNGFSGISIRMGNGNGTFKAVTGIFAGLTPVDTSFVADINQDDKPDLVFGNDGTLFLALGNGNGSFKNPLSYASGATHTQFYTQGIIGGDFNGDGVTDIGMATGGDRSIAVYLASTMTSYDLGSLSLTSKTNALQTLDFMKSVQLQLASALGAIGASQSRLLTALSNNQVSRENYLAAASRITDTDVALESAELTRKSILQQAASAVLAQANQQPALALQLMRS